MKITELNRDVKRLLKTMQKETSKNGFISDEKMKVFEKEFKRLLFADRRFEYMNKKSVLIMLRLNLLHRFISLHTFGLDIQFNNL